jgi:hypothetical protein
VCVHRSKSGQQDEVIFSLKNSFHPQESIFSSLEVTLPLRVHALIPPPQLSNFSLISPSSQPQDPRVQSLSSVWIIRLIPERERERERDVQYRDWGIGTEGEFQERPCHSHSQLVT